MKFKVYTSNMYLGDFELLKSKKCIPVNCRLDAVLDNHAAYKAFTFKPPLIRIYIFDLHITNI